MANVLFSRTDSPSTKPITDGQIIFDTSGNGKMYLDNGTTRLEMGGAINVDATLDATSTNPIQNKGVAGVMLGELEEIRGVTRKGFLTDALATKTLDAKIGTTDISSIGDGTVTGAISDVNGNLVFNNIYKHRDLGTITSSNRDEWIAKHINSDGTFNDIYVGDTVTIQDGVYNAIWIVAGLDTEYNKGNTALQTHHISLIPLTYLFTAPMNDTNTTAGGYAGSKMHKTTLVTVANNLKNALGSHLLERRVLLSNSMSTSIASGAGAGWTGASNNWAWTSAYCTLLTEVQVYGSTVFSSSFYDIGEGCSQLPLFKFVNHVYHGRFGFWLRAVASSARFAIADYSGSADYNSASSAAAVRPLITIG